MRKRNFKRTRPLFLRTGSVEVEVLRPSESQIVNGRKVENPPSIKKVRVNIQPLRFRDLWMMPEADRNRQWYYVVCDPCEDIRGASEGSPNIEADIIKWNGQYYKVMKSAEWQMGVLDHKTFLIARIPHSLGYMEE